MNKWSIVFGIVVVCILGVTKLILDRINYIKDNNFACEFLDNYRKFSSEIMKDNLSNKEYEWLKLNSVKMQKQMGGLGIAHAYKPAFDNYMYNNYQVIINSISHIKDMCIQNYGSSWGKQTIYSEVSFVDDMLLTYVGDLHNKLDYNVTELKNPLIWIREGVRFIITLPIIIMYWSGIMKYSTYNSLSNNFIVKLISFLVALIGLISSIVTIVTGYNPFIDIIGKL